MGIVHAIYSDPHFNHKNIIRYCDRCGPDGTLFGTVEAMNEHLIEQYNARVGGQDRVLWLGDCFFKGTYDENVAIMRRLNGHKLLIRGNHDRGQAAMASLGFELVAEELVARIGGRTCRLSHYPYAGLARAGDLRYVSRAPKKIRGEVLIHGHTHSNKRRVDNRICVCVEAWNYGPAPFDEVRSLVMEVP